MPERYDEIGIGYRTRRKPDPRIAEFILRELGDCRTVLNVGAGTGSYEPMDREVIAIEPSLTMIRQRPEGAAPVVRASAEDLPFPDKSFDATLAILTLHHWPDQAAGLRELSRVARDRIVILTWDPDSNGFWLTDDYFPEILQIDHQIFASLKEWEHVIPVPIPHDCVDGFLGAYWRRPEVYLDAEARAAISAFSSLTDVDRRIDQLRRDIEDGTWDLRHGDLRRQSSLDIGYRIVRSQAR